MPKSKDSSDSSAGEQRRLQMVDVLALVGKEALGIFGGIGAILYGWWCVFARSRGR